MSEIVKSIREYFKEKPIYIIFTKGSKGIRQWPIS